MNWFYSLKTLKKKILKFSIPIIMVYMIWLILDILKSNRLDFKSAIAMFCLGNYGPGAYYYWILIQFIFLYLAIYKIIKKYNVHALIGFGIINFFYELLGNFYKIDLDIYEVVIIRFIFAMAIGIWMGINRRKRISAQYLIEMLIIGGVFLLLPYIGTYKYQVFTRCSDLSMMSIFWCFPILWMALFEFSEYKTGGQKY